MKPETNFKVMFPAVLPSGSLEAGYFDDQDYMQCQFLTLDQVRESTEGWMKFTTNIDHMMHWAVRHRDVYAEIKVWKLRLCTGREKFQQYTLSLSKPEICFHSVGISEA